MLCSLPLCDGLRGYTSLCIVIRCYLPSTRSANFTACYGSVSSTRCCAMLTAVMRSGVLGLPCTRWCICQDSNAERPRAHILDRGRIVRGPSCFLAGGRISLTRVANDRLWQQNKCCRGKKQIFLMPPPCSPEKIFLIPPKRIEISNIAQIVIGVANCRLSSTEKIFLIPPVPPYLPRTCPTVLHERHLDP